MVGAVPGRLVAIMVVVCCFVLAENDDLLFVVEVVFVQVFAVDCFAFEPFGNICLFDLLLDELEAVEVFGALLAVTTLLLLLVIRLPLLFIV